jgi:hypothetical protein
MACPRHLAEPVILSLTKDGVGLSAYSPRFALL